MKNGGLILDRYVYQKHERVCFAHSRSCRKRNCGNAC